MSIFTVDMAEEEREGGAEYEAIPDEGVSALSPEGRQVDGVSARQAVVILVSMFVGLGLLSQPYALRVGGWAALVSQAATVVLFSFSAVFIDSCCSSLPMGVATSFPTIAMAAGGRKYGRTLSMLATIVGVLEMFCTLAIAIIVAMDQIELLFPFQWSAVMVAIAAVFVSMIAKINKLVPLFGCGTIASIALALVVISLPVFDSCRKCSVTPLPTHSIVKWPGLLQASGVFALSCSGHSSLPAFRSAMNKPDMFKTVILFSFCGIFMIHFFVGSIGYWYWGESVSPIVTDDLANLSPFADCDSRAFAHFIPLARIIPSFVAISCMAKIPMMVIVIQEMLSVVLKGGSNISYGYNTGLRLGVAIAATGLATIARQSLGEFLGLVGGFCSMNSSMILPALFLCFTSWHRRSLSGRLGLLLFLALGMGFLASVTFYNFLKLVRDTQHEHM